MSFTITNPAIAEYVILCDDHLRDLPAPVAAQLRRDIEEIVAEVCGELQGAPQDLVGPPLRFVTDLRTAAGLAPPPAAVIGSDAGEGGGALRDRVRSFWEHRATRWVRNLVPELRPAWWVVRGFVVAVALARLTGAPWRPSWLLGFVPYWPAFGSAILATGTIAGGVYLSVEAGRRPLSRRQRALRLAASVIAVVFAFVLLGEAKSWSDGHDFAPPYVERPAATRHPPQAPLGATVAGEFTPVVIGSRRTGARTEVFDLTSARGALDELLVDNPPAAIFIEGAGQQINPRSPEEIEAALQSLAEDGLLNR